MNKSWDTLADPMAFHRQWLREAFRVLKPGGLIKVFSGTRTKHRLEGALEDVGFILFNDAAWVQGQGFPKSLDLSKAIDVHLGRVADREVLGVNPSSRPKSKKHSGRGFDTLLGEDSAGVQTFTAAASPEAELFAGWGTALKPSWEPFVLGAKPPVEESQC